MKYLVRVLKYFVFITVVMALILLALSLAGIVENMIVMLNINTNYSKAVQGVIIVLAVAFNVYNNRKSAGLIAPRKKRAAAAPKKEA